MATEKQIAANRRNAQLSTGPITPEGRAAVRLNGIKHGLSAKTLVLPGEDASEFEALLDSFEAEYRPATLTEEILVRDMAMATWRRLRLLHLEAAFLQKELGTYQNLCEQYHPQLDSTGRLAFSVARDSETRILNNLSRYEARLERSFYKALREFQRLRALSAVQPRPEPPAAPSPDPQIGSGLPLSDSPATSSHVRNLDHPASPAVPPDIDSRPLARLPDTLPS